MTAEPARAAIPRLLEQHGDRLYSLALRLCGGPAEAEDLVQQTFLNAWRRWEQFEGRSDPATWLYTIAVRACRRHQRRRSGEPQRMESLDELLPEGEGALADFPSPLDERIREEAREVVLHGLAGLPLEFRLPLVLKDIVELPLADVAAVLGIKEETAKTRVYRARLKLRRELEKTLPHRPGPVHPKNQLCLDLLRAKMEALDRGVDLAFPEGEICARCQTVFATLDLEKDTCLRIGRGELPAQVREVVLRGMR
jgi:RNA polymerase sigma-70 factor (ECF subfamily)